MDISEIHSSELIDIDRAYLAGLFDGEGCISVTIGTRKFFSRKKQKKCIHAWGRIHFAISSKDHLLLELIKRIIGFGNVYRSKKRIYSYRITDRKQIINIIRILVPFVKLKVESLQLARDATLFLLKRGNRSRWTREELIFFHDKYVRHSQKIFSSGKRKGRPPKYTFHEIISRLC